MVYGFGSKVEESDRQMQERLLELRTIKYYDPEENDTLKNAMISTLLLDTIINMCTSVCDHYHTQTHADTANTRTCGGAVRRWNLLLAHERFLVDHVLVHYVIRKEV